VLKARKGNNLGAIGSQLDAIGPLTDQPVPIRVMDFPRIARLVVEADVVPAFEVFDFVVPKEDDAVVGIPSERPRGFGSPTVGPKDDGGVDPVAGLYR